eukprot:6599036-Pyramimonas_sp.AAC.1
MPTSDIRAGEGSRAPLHQRHTDAPSAAGHRSASSQQPPELEEVPDAHEPGELLKLIRSPQSLSEPVDDAPPAQSSPTVVPEPTPIEVDHPSPTVSPRSPTEIP